MKNATSNILTIFAGLVIGAGGSAKNCNVEETFPNVPTIQSVGAIDAGVNNHVSTR